MPVRIFERFSFDDLCRAAIFGHDVCEQIGEFDSLGAEVVAAVTANRLTWTDESAARASLAHRNRLPAMTCSERLGGSPHRVG